MAYFDNRVRGLDMQNRLKRLQYAIEPAGQFTSFQSAETAVVVDPSTRPLPVGATRWPSVAYLSAGPNSCWLQFLRKIGVQVYDGVNDVIMAVAST